MNKILLITFILLIGCNQVPKKLEGTNIIVKKEKTLSALDKFWDTLGGKVE